MKNPSSNGDSLLVTGGAGMIGSALVRAALDDGYRVGVLDNFSVGKRAGIPSGRRVQIFRGDIRDVSFVHRVYSAFRPSRVAHLAALHFIPHCDQRPFDALDINILGTESVLSGAEKFRPRHIFFASTAAVYSPKTKVQREDTKVNPVDIYGITKLVGERLMEGYHLRTKLPVSMGRIFNVYGRNEMNPHLIPEIIQQISSGHKVIELGNLESRRDYIHADDIADAILLLGKNNRRNYLKVNIGTGKSWNAKQVVELIIRASGRRVEIKVDPARLRKVDRPSLKSDSGLLNNITGWNAQVTLANGLSGLYDESIAT